MAAPLAEVVRFLTPFASSALPSASAAVHSRMAPSNSAEQDHGGKQELATPAVQRDGMSDSHQQTDREVRLLPSWLTRLHMSRAVRGPRHKLEETDLVTLAALVSELSRLRAIHASLLPALAAQVRN
jgi:hypothetical protein